MNALADRTGRRNRLKTLSVAILFLCAISLAVTLPSPTAWAVDILRLSAQDYPAQLLDGQTLGQSFIVDSDDVTIVGGKFATYSTSDSGFTLTLKAGGVDGAVVMSTVIDRALDNAWAELELGDSLTPGTYYLEASAVVGLIAWWSNSTDGYKDGSAYANGAVANGDRTLVLRNDLVAPVDPPVESPGMTNGIANGMSFVSNGMTLTRDDGSFPYDYAPSVIVEDSTERMWWCGQNAGGDGVYYAERAVGSTDWSRPEIVLAVDQEWEGIHVCDPSVVAGDFIIDGRDYSYVMFYGAADGTGQNTKLGTAYSNDGINWTKTATTPLLADPQQIYDYGIGMPAAFSTDSGTRVAYFNSGDNSSTVVRNFSDQGELSDSAFKLPFSSTDTFADLAFSQSEHRWYLATKSQSPGLGDQETYVYRSQGPNLKTTDWVYLGVIGEWLTGFPLNHNAGWYRDAAGNLYEEDGEKTLVFGAQDGGEGTTDPGKWDLATVTISGEPVSEHSPGAFALTSPANGAVIDPLDIGSFTWTEAPAATSYTLTVATNPSMNPARSVLSTTVHATSRQPLRAAFTTAPYTQRMALQPGTTYYWSVTAVNEAGKQLAQNGPFVLRTTPDYRLDLSGGYVSWAVVGGAEFTSGAEAVLELTGPESALRTGAGYSPLRANISALDAIEIVLSEQNPTTVQDVVVQYKLQSDPYNDPWRSVTVPIDDTTRDGQTILIDMSDQPGWGVQGNSVALFSLGSTQPGSLAMTGLSFVDRGDD